MDKKSIRRQAKELVVAGCWALEEMPWELDYDDELLETRSAFLGTVFSIMPSGKYYMPWACSNVDPCPRCKTAGCDYCGQIGSREAFEDELMSEDLEYYAGRRDTFITAGKGDPCDLFITQVRDREVEI